MLFRSSLRFRDNKHLLHIKVDCKDEIKVQRAVKTLISDTSYTLVTQVEFGPNTGFSVFYVHFHMEYPFLTRLLVHN